MTQYTANQTETYWDQPSHFTPPGTPVKGDTIIVPAGYRLHVVGTHDIGTSEAMGVQRAIEFQGANCRLVFEEDSFLRYRGQIFQTGGGANSSEWCRYLFKPGSTLWHDSTEALDPENTHYSCLCGSGTNLYCIVDFAESDNPNKRVTIGSEAGGGRGWFESLNFSRLGGGNCPEGTGFVDHIRWGGRDSTNYSYTVRWGLGVTGMRFRNMSFDDCGGISIPSMHSSAQPVFENLWMGNTKTTDSLNIPNNQPLDNKGILRQATVDARCYITSSRDWEISECTFSSAKPQFLSGPAAKFENIIVLAENAQSWSTWPGKVNGLVYIADHDEGNPHGISTRPAVAVNEIYNFIFIYAGTAKIDAGDAILLNGGGPHHADVRNVLVLDDKGHTANDHTLLTLAGGPGATVSLRNCTTIGHGVHTGETFAGETGQILSMVDCLFASYSGANRWKLRDINPETIHPKVLNPVDPVNAHHNAGFGLAVGSNGKHYHDLNLLPDDGTIGANDVDADPEFGRMGYLEDFDLANGGPGTMRSAIDNIKLWNHPTLGSPVYSPLNLFDFFLGPDNNNWAPTAAVFENSGSGGAGTTIGAKGWQSGDPPPPVGVAGFEPFGPGVWE